MTGGELGSPSWNLFIIIFLAIATGYGFILQKEKAAATLISTYIALAVTSIWGEAVYNILSGKQIMFNSVWLAGHVNPFTVKVVIFGLFIVLLSLKGEYISTKAGAVGSTIFLFLFSFLTSTLILSSIFSFMDPASRNLILSQSSLGNLIFKYNSWWVALPAIVIIIAGFKKKSSNREQAE
jgi:hypothetical protein